MDATSGLSYEPAVRGCVGREREKEAIARATDALAAGRGAAIAFLAAPGMGKTTLLEALAQVAHSRNLSSAWGVAWDGTGAPVFWPMLQALRALLPAARAHSDAIEAAIELQSTRLLFLTLHLLEWLFPAVPQKRSIGWRLQGFIAFMIGGAIVNGLPQLWAPYAAELRLIDLGALPPPLGALVLVLSLNLVGYFWHRARHQYEPLRRLHQLHHSAERHDISSAFLFHPLETAIMAGLLSVPAILLGISPEAAMLAGMFGFGMACFTHLNVRTPRWLGYIVQRPESHSLHHARGVHAFNYADLPVVDMLFGTFRNAERHEASIGFWDGASRKLASMLVLLDVTTPGPATAEQKPARVQLQNP